MTIEQSNEIDKIMKNPNSEIEPMEYDPEVWGYCYGWLFRICSACHKIYQNPSAAMINALTYVEPAMNKIRTDYLKTINEHYDEDLCKNLMAYLLIAKTEGSAAGKIKQETRDAAILGFNKRR